MKKNFLLSFAVLGMLLMSCSSTPTKQSYTPIHESEWAFINDSIQHNWINASGKCPTLPDSFAYAFWYNIQFYWDTYYTQLGLLEHNQLRLAKGGANNLLYLVDSLGFVPNANADWGDNRSQPPYLSMMVTDIYKRTGDKDWLKKAYVTLQKEYAFWTDTTGTGIEDHRTAISGLQRFFHHATQRELLEMYQPELTNRFGFPTDADTATRLKIASNFAAEAATGMDFTTRFENRCPDFVAVDLNCNLYLYELNFAFIEKELSLSDGKDWLQKAEVRKDLINKYCWNEEKGFYYDYDFVNKRSSKIAAATGLSALYAGIASKEQGERVVKNLSLIESEHGIVTTQESEQEHSYQWDHVSVWPPMQSLAIMALDRYGYKTEAKRVAMKYLDVVAANFVQPDPAIAIKSGDTIKRVSGKIYEKYTRNGTINDREYVGNVMMGWSAGTYAFAYGYLKK